MPDLRSPARWLVAAVAVVGATLTVASAQAPRFFPVDEVRPGMVAEGRTVFAGDELSDFRAHIIGVLKNTIGPRHDLILARLEGGPLATTGVIEGMSGSPVYIDGRLLGAVSYALGSFPREPLAGITPIGEMIDAVDGGTGRPDLPGLQLTWPATEADVFQALRAVAARAASPLSSDPGGLRVLGPAALASLAPGLRPIGAAMVLSGFDPALERAVGAAIGQPVTGTGGPAPGARVGEATSQAPRGDGASAATALRPGDAVGMALIRGDLEMGATGTVTYVDGDRLYAFGHPFLNLGTTRFAMTRSHVYTVLPSLDASMKIASLGPVIGVMGQDRSTAVGGRLGAGPGELKISLTLSSAGRADRQFTYYAIHDPQLTALFAYVGVMNTLVAYERQMGTLSIAATGTATFGDEGRVSLDDVYTGDNAIAAAAGGLTAAIGTVIANPFAPVMPTALDVHLTVAERDAAATIERAWLDTVRPEAGATHTLSVQLRRYRGGLETIEIPITMPAKPQGPLTLLVSDGPSLGTLEQRELAPGQPTSLADVFARLARTRTNNRLYVRLIAPATGTVIGGEPLPALPSSVRSVLAGDPSVATAPVSKTVLGAWERRLDFAVHGSRELTLTIDPRH
ncbi:MAG: SpoIVB peptidase S55 domain-containing protein [Vicinamibacterales bacterium]